MEEERREVETKKKDKKNERKSGSLAHFFSLCFLSRHIGCIYNTICTSDAEKKKKKLEEICAHKISFLSCYLFVLCYLNLYIYISMNVQIYK